VETGKVKAETKEIRGPSSLALTPDGSQLIACGSGIREVGELRFLTTDLKKELLRLEGHQAEVVSLAIAPNRKWLATGSVDQTVRTWSLPEGKASATLQTRSELPFGLAFSPDSKYVLCGGPESTIQVWALETKRLVHTLRGHKGLIYHLTFSPDGKLLFSSSE